MSDWENFASRKSRDGENKLAIDGVALAPLVAASSTDWSQFR